MPGFARDDYMGIRVLMILDTIGLAKGLADQLEGVTVGDLVRRNPHRAGCRLRFSLDLSDRGRATA